MHLHEHAVQLRPEDEDGHIHMHLSASGSSSSPVRRSRKPREGPPLPALNPRPQVLDDDSEGCPVHYYRDLFSDDALSGGHHSPIFARERRVLPWEERARREGSDVHAYESPRSSLRHSSAQSGPQAWRSVRETHQRKRPPREPLKRAAHGTTLEKKRAAIPPEALSHEALPRLGALGPDEPQKQRVSILRGGTVESLPRLPVVGV